jgi:HEAT repeat protein
MRGLVRPIAKLPISAAVACAIALAASCKPPDPADPQTWIARLSDPDVTVRKNALQELRKRNVHAAAVPIAGLLKDAALKEDAAFTLGVLGGPESVQPLLDAIDTTVGAGSDAATRNANRANAKIAEALGAIGYPNAGPALLRLARSRDELVRLAAVQALGEVRYRDAVPELSHLIDDESASPLVVKKAVVSLGQIADPAALPALTHALVIQRRGVSFLSEASFALFELREASVEPLISIALDQDPDYAAWARATGRAPAGTYAKVAIVLGDLGDPRAIPVLIKLLGYTDPDPIPSTARLLTSVVRQFAADALGRMRAKEAAAEILSLVSVRSREDEEPALFYGNALVWIGDRSQARELLRRAQAGSVRPRLAVLEAAVLLGPPALQQDLTKLVAKQADGRPKQCVAALAELGVADAPESSACRALAQRFAALAAPLAAAEECEKGNAVACWTKKVDNVDPWVRARAAYELGRANAVSAVVPLVQRTADAELTPRLAAIRALEWLAQDPAAQADLKAAAPQIKAQLAAEQGRIQFLKVNEELRRLQARLTRL